MLKKHKTTNCLVGFTQTTFFPLARPKPLILSAPKTLGIYALFLDHCFCSRTFKSKSESISKLTTLKLRTDHKESSLKDDRFRRKREYRDIKDKEIYGKLSM